MLVKVESETLIMADSALLISSEKVTENCLKNFVFSLGGNEVIGSIGSYVVSKGTASVWLGLQPKSWLSVYEEKDIVTFRKALKSNLESIIELDLSHTNGSYDLYLRIAYEAGLRWRIVLDDVENKIITEEHLKEMFVEDKIYIPLKDITTLEEI